MLIGRKFLRTPPPEEAAVNKKKMDWCLMLRDYKVVNTNLAFVCLFLTLMRRSLSRIDNFVKGLHVPQSKHGWIFNVSRFQKPWNVGNVRLRSFRFNKAACDTRREVEQMMQCKITKCKSPETGGGRGWVEGHTAAFETADHLKPNIKSHFLNVTVLFWYLSGSGR